MEKIELNEGLLEIGERAFYQCSSLKHVNIPSTIKTIGSFAFCNCSSLKHISIPSSVTTFRGHTFKFCNRLEEVELCDGLLEIGNDAFLGCSTLRHVNIPSTVKTIGSFVFYGAPLHTLCLPDSIESIGDRAFCHGRFPNIRIPSRITTIEERMFFYCSSMFSAELPETITQMVAGGCVFDNCRSLRNVAVPPHAAVGVDTFMECTDLLQLFDSSEDIVNALKHRFDNLPIHKMIYYHSYNNLSAEQLNNAASQTMNLRGNPTGSQQDCLGMTPLHILACSTVQNIELYQVLIEKYPENMIVKDEWGTVPLFYAVWGNAPSEIVQLLVDSYQSINPDYEFDWTGMITTLGETYAPECSIKMLLDLQKVSFPAQKIDWDEILNTLANNDAIALRSIFQIVVNASISTRIDAIGLKLWREDMAEMMAEPIPRNQSKGVWLSNVKSKLSHYMRLNING